MLPSLSHFLLQLLLSWCGTFVPGLPWLCLHLPFKDQTIQCYSNLLWVIMNCVFIFFGVFDLFMCIYFLWIFLPFYVHSYIVPTFLLGAIVVMAWLCFGNTIVMPSSCIQGLDCSMLLWPSKCESLCKFVFLFLDVHCGHFFFCNFQPSLPFL
jgi:hypothetical protein